MGAGVMAEKTTSQCAAILKYLEKHPQGLTACDALMYFGCMRLAARISDLRAKGYVIESVPVHGENYCRYRLVKETR